MITEWELYWITRLDHILIACTISVVVGILPLVINSIVWVVEEDDKTLRHRAKIAFLISLPLVLIGGLGCVFVPTTKEMAMIKVLPMLANSKFVEEELPKDAQRIYRLGIRALEEKLEIKENTK